MIVCNKKYTKLATLSALVLMRGKVRQRSIRTWFIVRIIVLTYLLLNMHCVNQSINENTSAPPTSQTDIAKQNFYNLYSVRCADKVSFFSGTELLGFSSSKALGPPQGAGNNSGSLDVFVLGNNQSATFEVAGYSAVNSSSFDIVIYENPFLAAPSTNQYAFDFATLEVSNDLVNWYGFVPTHSTPDNMKTGKQNLVGLNTVSVNYLSNLIDPHFSLAGGDFFELSDARRITNRSSNNVLTYVYGNSLATDGVMSVKYFKIVDGGNTLPDGAVGSNGVDIDAICLLNFAVQ